MPLHLPPSVKNWTSLAGAMIALISVFMIVFLFAVTVFFAGQAAYLGLVVYILLPSVMIFGLLLIPLGMWLKVRREHRVGSRPERGWPHIDLNDSQHRNAAFIFIVGTTVLLFASAIGSYEAFHYTESVPFCGTLCHQVMEPEYVAHQDLAARPGRLRRLPCRTGRRLVRAQQIIRHVSGLRGADRRLSAADPHPHRKPASGAGGLRTVSLAAEILRLYLPRAAPLSAGCRKYSAGTSA